jgi:CDP-glucose 4,6-dehydratase
MASLLKGETLRVRSPRAIRPWQHVLEPLSGYLLLAESLWNDPAQFSQSWNFGPSQDDAQSVRWLVERLSTCWGKKASWQLDADPTPHEAHLLTLDSAKARGMLGWRPRWTLEQALQAVADWYEVYQKRGSVREIVLQQIAQYESLADRGAPEFKSERTS